MLYLRKKSLDEVPVALIESRYNDPGGGQRFSYHKGTVVKAWICTCERCGADYVFVAVNIYFNEDYSVVSEQELIYWSGELTVETLFQFGNTFDLLDLHVCWSTEQQ